MPHLTPRLLAIHGLRVSLWDRVAKRTHRPGAVYTFGRATGSIMLHGAVDYELRDGGAVRGVEWAARGTLETAGDGRVRWRFYQVYLDSAAQGGGEAKE